MTNANAVATIWGGFIAGFSRQAQEQNVDISSFLCSQQSFGHV